MRDGPMDRFFVDREIVVAAVAVASLTALAMSVSIDTKQSGPRARNWAVLKAVVLAFFATLAAMYLARHPSVASAMDPLSHVRRTPADF